MVVYETSVGMEVHAALRTRSKMFCRCPVAFGGQPNTRTCPVCLGLPGALPVPNREAVELVLRAAIALNCTVPEDSVFHRKNYFYPDLPKGYQVSQYGETNPIGYGGWLDVPMSGQGVKRVHIRRVHLEEDTGKLMHVPGEGSGIDFNRAGVPLMEIVTEFPPDLTSPEDSREYLVQLRSLLLWLGVCDGKMEEGSLRCEPNVSVREAESPVFGTKTEIKNLNSFRSVQLGVAFESTRQIAVLERGEAVAQETRGWNEAREESYLMRTKESEQDYRYFTCPDLAPMHFVPSEIERIRAALPELPIAKREWYERELGLSAGDAERLVSDRAWSEWFDEVISLGGDPKAACNWMNGDLARLLNDKGHEASRMTPALLFDLLELTRLGTVSGKTAKTVFEEAFLTGAQPSTIVADRGLTQISDPSAISEAVRNVLATCAVEVASYRGGKLAVLGFIVGKVMQTTGGRANVALVQEEVLRQLAS